MAITSQNEGEAIVKLVAGEAPAQILRSLVLGKLVNRDYEKTVAQDGDAVNIPNADATQPPARPAIVLKYFQAPPFQIPDVTKVLAVPDLLKAHMQPAVEAIVKRIETDIATLYSNLTLNTAVGSAAPITEAVIDSAAASLLRAEVPPRDRKFLVVNPGTFSAMRQISCFAEFQTAGGPGGANGIIEADIAGAGPMGANGKIKDFLVFCSQYIQKPSSTTYNMAFARDALGLVIRRLPKPLPRTGPVVEYAEMGNFGVRIVLSYVPNSLVQQFTVDCLCGCAVIRNNFGVPVQSSNSIVHKGCIVGL